MRHFNKIIVGLFISVIILGTTHFRAYIYADAELKEKADSGFRTAVSKKSCDQLVFVHEYKPKNFMEVFTQEWVCLNKTTDGYFFATTVESDGYVKTEQISLTKDELVEILELNGRLLPTGD